MSREFALAVMDKCEWTVVSFVMWTNSMSIIVAQSFICSAVTS